MATASAQRTRRSGASAMYATKDAKAISALNAPANAVRFEARLQEIREAHGKDGVRAVQVVGEDGVKRDAVDEKGNTIYEARFVQAYPVVQSFGHDELDPDDPESWERANELGKALATKLAPGHPALVATEVNGRSGMVHNHILIGARHPETGRALRSVNFDPAKIAITHDRVLEANGFKQREDLREVTRAAEQQMAQARQQVIDSAEKDLSPSQLQKRIESAEKKVELRPGVRAKDPRTKQQERRQKEHERYKMTKEVRAAVKDADAPMPKERFSEVELEKRVKEALENKRSTDWQRLDEVGRERGVTITKRGKDVSYGMMLYDEYGLVQEPANAHRRRGSRLGDGYRLEDVEAALRRNRDPQPIGGLGGVNPQPLSGLGEEHQQVMDRVGQDFQRELLEEHGDLLQPKTAEPVAETPAEAPAEPAIEEPAVEETPTERAERRRQELLREAEEAKEREVKELEAFRAEQAEHDREEKQRFDELMAKQPAQPEAAEVEAPEVSEAEAEEPQRIEHEAEEPQASESKWSKLKERDAERAAPELVEQEQQREAEKPEPKRREPGQEKQIIRLSGAEREDRELIAVATEMEDGSAYIDWQLAHHDPAAEDRQGLHLMADKGRIGRQRCSAEHFKRIQQVAGENRTEAEGKQVLAVRTNLRPHGKSYVPSLKAMQPSEQQVQADVLDKQRESEDRARAVSAAERDEQAHERLEAKEASDVTETPDSKKKKRPTIAD